MPLRRLRRVTGRIAPPFILSAYAWLAFGRLAPDLPEVEGRVHLVVWLAFFARTFWLHASIAIIAAGLAAAAGGRRAAAALALPALGLCVFGLSGSGPPPHAGGTLSILSANLLVLNPDAGPILGEIDRLDPDVIVLVEYTRAKHDRVHAALSAEYPFFAEAMRHDRYGMAIYSRFEFAGPAITHPHREAIGPLSRATGVVGLSDAQLRIPIIAPTRSGGARTVTLQAIHAAPPTLPAMFAEQRRLLRWLAGWAADAPGPIIAAGDFNSTPAAQSEAWLRRAGLRDAFAEAGRGRGATWPILKFGAVPRIRIDQIRIGHGLTPTSAKVGRDIGSDHLPIFARLIVEDP